MKGFDHSPPEPLPQKPEGWLSRSQFERIRKAKRAGKDVQPSEWKRYQATAEWAYHTGLTIEANRSRLEVLAAAVSVNPENGKARQMLEDAYGVSPADIPPTFVERRALSQQYAEREYRNAMKG